MASVEHRWRLSLIGAFISVLIIIGLLIVAGYYLEQQQTKSIYDLLLKLIPIRDFRFLTRIGLWTSVIMIVVGAFRYNPYHQPTLIYMCVYWALWRIIAMVTFQLPLPEEGLQEYPAITSIQSFWDVIQVGLGSRYVLYFSGHTGLPFFAHFMFQGVKIKVKWFSVPLIFSTYVYTVKYGEYAAWVPVLLVIAWIIILIFRNKEVRLSKCFFVWSFVMALSVLSIRSHWGGDVLGAYFAGFFVYYTGMPLCRKVDTLCDQMLKAHRARKGKE